MGVYLTDLTFTMDGNQVGRREGVGEGERKRREEEKKGREVEVGFCVLDFAHVLFLVFFLPLRITLKEVLSTSKRDD